VSALPLVEATTLSKLGDETARYGRIRVWGSVGFIAAVVAVGYLIDATNPHSVLWVIAGLMAGMLLLSFTLSESKPEPHESDDLPVWQIVRKPAVLAVIGASALMAAAHGPYYTFYTIHLVDHGYSKSAAGHAVGLGRDLRDRHFHLDVAAVSRVHAAQHPDCQHLAGRFAFCGDRLEC